MKKQEPKTIDVLAELDAIKDRLDTLFELATWGILADQRFKTGDRVTFSPKAKRNGINKRRKSQFGEVMAVTNHFSITVLLDGTKKATSFHHSFFQKEQK